MNLSATLQSTDNNGFCSGIFHAFAPAFFGMHVTCFAADESFIDFNFAARTAELYEGTALDCKPDAMQHEPSGFLSDAQSAMNFIGANAILAANEQPHCGKPFLKRNRGIFKDGSDLQRKLLLGMVAIAAVHTRFLKVANFFRAAIRAAHFSVRPANRNHELTAVFVVGKELDCLL